MFTYSLSGDLRFISHHDTLRLFQRALARAEVPVRYTEGFNPRPRMTLPLPRPVGVASDHEAVVIDVVGAIDPSQTLQALQRQTPADLCLIDARQLAPGEKPRPARVRYRVDPANPPIADLPERVQRLLDADVVPIERVHPKKPRRQTVDLRPSILDLRLADAGVEMTLDLTVSGSAKPSEIAGLLGYDAGAVNHRVRRLEIQWQ